MMADFGRLLIVMGLAVAGVGLLLAVGGRLPWLGKLPGDLAYESEHIRVYFPLATSIVVSLVISLLFYLFRK